MRQHLETNDGDHLAGAASNNQDATRSITRRSFLHSMGLGAAAVGLSPAGHGAGKRIQGFEKAPDDPNAARGWKPVSDRKIRVGLVGDGVRKFAADFGLLDSSNVRVDAV